MSNLLVGVLRVFLLSNKAVFVQKSKTPFLLFFFHRKIKPQSTVAGISVLSGLIPPSLYPFQI